MTHTERTTAYIRSHNPHSGATRIIRVPPGEYASRSHFSADDEGYSRLNEVYYHNDEAGEIELVASYDARDCDGRIAQSILLTCPVFSAKGTPHGFPVWEIEGQENRDYAAEAAGY